MGIIRKVINKIKQKRFAKTEAQKLEIDGTLLNAFYKTKTIFIHIPKTAGMSVVKAIFGDVIGGGHRKITFYKSIFGNNLDNYFKFCFVRNPFDRLYSSYKFLEKGGVNVHDKNAFEMYLKNYTDFEDFVLNGLNEKLMREIIHFTPQTEFVCNKNGKIIVDFVGRFEKLEKDVESLSNLLGREIKLPHLNSNQKNKSSYQIYTKEMCKKVRGIYNRDFDILSY